MPLTVGDRLGQYQVVCALGAGGMGEVYRARDTRLKRDVALKVLPATVAGDVDRLARFQREAEVLAALNNPHIAQVYGIDDGTDAAGVATRALVMELVDGDDLSQRLVSGPLPTDEALEIARQIAVALEAAHEQGIIHRDLKPANIKIRSDGAVKVLDFGLAKATERSTSSAALANSPTFTSPAMITHAGVILGTAAYMSPEQARGKPVDKRADIWAFGCVFYEMLTGARAFPGEDVTETLAAIMRGEPDWTRVPSLSEPLLVLLKACLAKDPRRRVGDMAAVRFALELPPQSAPMPRSRSSRYLATAAVGVIAVSLATWMASRFRQQEAEPELPIRVTASLPDNLPLRGGHNTVSISPDGTKVIVVAGGDEEGPALWLRPLGSRTLTKLPETDGGTGPFWSPDGQEVAFFADRKLKVVSLSGGAPEVLADAPLPRGGTWADDTLLFVPRGQGPLATVNRAGGAVQVLEATKDVAPLWPAFLPDGEHFLFLSRPIGKPANVGLRVGSVRSPELVSLTSIKSSAVYGYPGHLLFQREGMLFAQPFDTAAFQLLGQPLRLDEGLSGLNIGSSGISASRTGIVAFRAGSSLNARQLTWFDREGKPVGTVGGPQPIVTFRLSPDQRRALIEQDDPETGARELWLIDDVATGIATRFASGAGAVWSPDGRTVMHRSEDQLFRRDVAGRELEPPIPNRGVPADWSPDGRQLLVLSSTNSDNQDVVMLQADGRGEQPFLHSTANEGNVRISPDGRWVAYATDETGRDEVYVQPFPAGGQKRRISVAGGRWPRWRADSGELFFVSGRTVMSIDVQQHGDQFRASSPKPLFAAPLNAGAGGVGVVEPFEVSLDGNRFLLLPRPEAGSLALLVNWHVADK